MINRFQIKDIYTCDNLRKIKAMSTIDLMLANW